MRIILVSMIVFCYASLTPITAAIAAACSVGVLFTEMRRLEVEQDA